MSLDVFLALLLLVAVPADALRRERSGAPQPRIRRYVRAMLVATILDVILATRWIAEHRSAAALGLGWPISTTGLIGCAVASVVVAALAIAGRRAPSGKVPRSTDVLPQTPAERAVFAAMALVLGASWELLYRGFLLWWLAPLTGLVPAVLVAATAYAVAHGVRDAKALAGSFVSALLFTAGYAVTGSLWWLIAIHIALPMLALTIRRAPAA